MVVSTCGDAELCIPAESGAAAGADCLQHLLAGLALTRVRHKREPLSLVHQIKRSLHTLEQAHSLLLSSTFTSVATILMAIQG